MIPHDASVFRFKETGLHIESVLCRKTARLGFFSLSNGDKGSQPRLKVLNDETEGARFL